MKHYRIISLILLLCLALGAAAPAAFAAETPEITAQSAAETPEASAQPALEAPAITARSAIVIDLGTGEVIWEKNADEVRSPASLTKIMTGLLAVEAAEEGREDMTATVTAGNDCQFGMDSSSSNASIVSGEQMLYRDFFYCAMVVSANEACNVLASEIGGSLGGFVSMMNQRAASLGCEHTQFADTNGLSHDNRTTARELSVILREALDHEDFMTAFCTSYYDVPATNYSGERRLVSTDALTTRDSFYSQYGDYYYQYALGAKTGFTRAAGYCLASVAENEELGLKAMIIVMGCPGPLTEDSAEPESFRDTIRLYNWLFDNYSYQQILSPAEEIARVPAVQAEDESGVSLHCREELTLLLPNDAMSRRVLKTEIFEDRLIAPIPANTVLGRLTVELDGKTYGPYDLANFAEVKMAKGEFMKEHVDSFFARKEVHIVAAVLAAFLLIYLILVLRYRILRRKHLRERKRAEKQRRAASAQKKQGQGRGKHQAPKPQKQEPPKEAKAPQEPKKKPQRAEEPKPQSKEEAAAAAPAPSYESSLIKEPTLRFTAVSDQRDAQSIDLSSLIEAPAAGHVPAAAEAPAEDAAARILPADDGEGPGPAGLDLYSYNAAVAIARTAEKELPPEPAPADEDSDPS